jgi:hypothetical protein
VKQGVTPWFLINKKPGHQKWCTTATTKRQWVSQQLQISDDTVTEEKAALSLQRSTIALRCFNPSHRPLVG